MSGIGAVTPPKTQLPVEGAPAAGARRRRAVAAAQARSRTTDLVEAEPHKLDLEA